MNSILLNRKINGFLKMKENEIPELKRNDIDRMIEDLASEGRNQPSY